jgi:transposase
MAKPLLPDALWERIAPLLPKPKPRRFRYPGRKPVEHRKALTGILFVLKTGIDWEDLPQEMGCGCGMTCWRRLAEWTAAGVWQRLHELLLAELEYAGEIDWTRATIDSSHVRARGGGEATGPSPVDRRKKGSKHFVVTDGGGIPLAAIVTAANVPDVKGLEPAVDAVPPVRGKPGRPRRRPRELYADRGFDSDPHRRRLRRRGIRPRIARRGTPHGSGLGVYRWVSERTLSWLHNFGRLRVRKDHSGKLHQAFLTLGCSIICLNHLC